MTNIFMKQLQNSIRARFRPFDAISIFYKLPKAQKVMSICKKSKWRQNHQNRAAKRVLQLPLIFGLFLFFSLKPSVAFSNSEQNKLLQDGTELILGVKNFIDFNFPSLHHYNSSFNADIDYAYELALKNFQESTATKTDLHRALQTLCAHTAGNFILHYDESVLKKTFPLRLYFQDDRFYVLQGACKGSPIRAGDEILKINGLSVIDFLQSHQMLTPYLLERKTNKFSEDEFTRYRTKHLRKTLNELFWMPSPLLGPYESLNITYYSASRKTIFTLALPLKTGQSSLLGDLNEKVPWTEESICIVANKIADQWEFFDLEHIDGRTIAVCQFDDFLEKWDEEEKITTSRFPSHFLWACEKLNSFYLELCELEEKADALLIDLRYDDLSPFDPALCHALISLFIQNPVSSLQASENIHFLPLEQIASRANMIHKILQAQGEEAKIYEALYGPYGAQFQGKALQNYFHYLLFLLGEKSRNKSFTRFYPLYGQSLIQPYGNKAWSKPLYLLVTEETSGSSEAFAAVMKDNTPCKVIGRDSSGSALDMHTVELPGVYGIRAISFSRNQTLRKNHQPLDIFGIEPDFWLEQSPFSTGLDYELSQALYITAQDI